MRRLRRDANPRICGRRDDGSWSGRLGPASLPLARRVLTRFHDANGAGGEQLALARSTRATNTTSCSRSAATEEALDVPPPERAWSATEELGATRVPQLEHAAGRRDARHAYAILAGLTSSDGGMVAAATTSLPERAQEGRNYDYRYAWIRDQCIAGEAVAVAGAFPLLDDSVRFVGPSGSSQTGRRCEPAYTVIGVQCPGGAGARAARLSGRQATASATTYATSSSSTPSGRRCFCSRRCRT